MLALQTNSSLTQLNLEGNKVTEEGAKAVMEALKENEKLVSVKGFDRRQVPRNNKIEIKKKLNKNKKNNKKDENETRQEILDIRSAFRLINFLGFW